MKITMSYFYILHSQKLIILTSFKLFLIIILTSGTAARAQNIFTNPSDTATVILIRTSTADKIQAIGALQQLDFEPYGCRVYNGSLSQFLQGLKATYLKEARLSLIDGTGYADPIDLLLDTPLNSIELLNKALAPYHLQFVTIKEQVHAPKALTLQTKPAN